MIKFFRHIRRTLINENRMGKYFKYAIGEILLVVVGILIALQINNWNQKRLDKKFETTMLKEIKSSLMSDLEVYNIIKFRAALKKEAIQELLQMTETNKVYPDTTLLRIYNDMSLGVRFNYNKGGYQAVNSIGLDKISNDTLRTILIETYEHHYPRIELFFMRLDEYATTKEYLLNLHNALWKRIKIVQPDGILKIVSRPINSDGFLKDPNLIDRIKIEQDNLGVIERNNAYLNYIIETCLTAVNKELENYD